MSPEQILYSHLNEVGFLSNIKTARIRRKKKERRNFRKITRTKNILVQLLTELNQ